MIAVGASEASPNSAGLADDISEVAYFSSQGPTADDNRIKPDVVAPGYHLFSAQVARTAMEASCVVLHTLFFFLRLSLGSGCVQFERSFRGQQYEKGENAKKLRVFS